MAEIFTLTPAPPALGDPHAAPPLPPPPTVLPAPKITKDEPIPKSSLYHDKAMIRPKAMIGPTPETPPVGEGTLVKNSTMRGSPPGPPSPSVVGVNARDSGTTSLDTAVPQSDRLPDAQPSDVGVPPLQLVGQESGVPATSDSLNASQGSPDPPTKQSAQTQQASPSPNLNPTPNLYPSIHVTHNPNPVTDDAQTVTSQAPTTVASDLTPPPPDPTPTPGEATSEVDKPPQPPQQPPNPETPSPKPTELPNTPSRGEPPSPSIPVIYEPASSSFSPPNPYPSPRPAPDTLSYLESASLMSGTLESLSGLGEDGSSVGSDSEINGMTSRRTDKYGFLGGNQYSESGEKEVRVEVARQREMKWIDMFFNWDKWVKHRFQKVKLRCRKGIPSSLRSKAWQLLSNSTELLEANPGKFEELEREPGEAKWLDIIEKDLHRQFPFHEMFAARGGHGQQDLYRILKAYTIYRPDEGYCQAQAPVAAVLLMHMPAEQAFWCLVQICEKYLPGYYSAGLEAIQLDGEIFFSLLRRTCPMAYRHLKKFKIDPILYMTEWFMCIFSRTLPWACVLRVWDMFFCEGVKIVFRVGLVLLKQMLGSVDKLRELQGMYETMERLRNISPDMIREEVIVQEIIILPVTEALIERECSIQVRKWRESRGELMHQPGRRFHGTRAIHEYKRRAASISSGGSFSFLGSSVPPPGPLRTSSSLLSLPGFRKSKAPFHSQAKKGSFSGPSGSEGPSPQPHPLASASPSRGPAHKPPLPGGGPKAPAPHVQSPLAGTSEGLAAARPPLAPKAPPAQHPGSAPMRKTPPNTLMPSPEIVSEQITPILPSPLANNTPLPPFPEVKREAAAVKTSGGTEEGEGRAKKKSKEDKKKEKEEERQKLKEKKEKEKAEKERLRREKEKKKGAKKKDKAGAEAADRNGATAAKDST